MSEGPTTPLRHRLRYDQTKPRPASKSNPSLGSPRRPGVASAMRRTSPASATIVARLEINALPRKGPRRPPGSSRAFALGTLGASRAPHRGYLFTGATAGPSGRVGRGARLDALSGGCPLRAGVGSLMACVGPARGVGVLDEGSAQREVACLSSPSQTVFEARRTDVGACVSGRSAQVCRQRSRCPAAMKVSGRCALSWPFGWSVTLERKSVRASGAVQARSPVVSTSSSGRNASILAIDSRCRPGPPIDESAGG
jgi:hypothetical protein